MKLIIVDDEPLVLEHLQYLCGDIPGWDIAGAFTDPLQALRYIQEHPVELAVLDIQLSKMSGLDLLSRLRAVLPKLQAIFVTAYEEYSLAAWQENACGYLLKPIAKEDVQKALERASHLCSPSEELFLSTFGRFDLFRNGEAVLFKSRKAKELLALMTARMGGTTTMEMVIDRLWEGEAYTEGVKVKYRKAVMYLRQTLDELGLSRMLEASRGQLRMNFSGVKCDFFDMMNGDPKACAIYHGAFMTEYSWSEYYIPMLEHLSAEFHKRTEPL